MNTLRILKTGLVLMILAVGLTACEGSLTNLNENPNEPETAPPSLVLPNAILSSMNRIYDMGGLNGYVGGVWVQHYAKIQYVDEDRYNLSGRIGMVDDFWDGFYSETLQDLKSIKSRAEIDTVDTEGGANTIAIANILMAWNWQIMTDLWGPIPASEALQGNPQDEDTEQITNPVYDSQEAVYNYIIQLLDEAITTAAGGTAPFGSEDLIYQGDMEKWLKLANSLKLRVYMRMSDVQPDTAAAGIAEVFNDGNYMTSNEDNAMMYYQTYPNNNPVNQFFRTREDHKVSVTIMDYLKDLNDPRLHFYAIPIEAANVWSNEQLLEEYPDGRYPDSLYVGVTNGDINNSLPLNEASNIGHYFIAPRSPGIIMSYAEVEFILAEAALRGWIETSLDVETHYNNAITASMLMYDESSLSRAFSGFTDDLVYTQQGVREEEFPSGIQEAEIQDYLSGPAAWPTLGDMNTQMETIALQKWIALYGQGLQAWFEWRRLDHPPLEPGPEAVLNEVPKRLFYPFAEQSVNPSNYGAAVDMLDGPDNLTTRVWWDTQEPE